MKRNFIRNGLIFSLSFCALLISNSGWSSETTVLAVVEEQKPAVMDNKRLAILIERIDEKVKGNPGFWQFTVEGHDVMVITDERADRMRIIVPITEVEQVDASRMKRILQANFDSALDARYAIAKDVLWSVYVHPLSLLEDKQFLEAIGQVVNLATTYGSTYTSGGLIFQGGDSEAIERRKLIEKLINKGLAV